MPTDTQTKPYSLIFDFDGVIAHTIPIFRQALFQFFREKQLKITESEFETDGWASKSLAQFCVILAERYDIYFDVDTLRAQIWQTQVDLINQGLESDPTLIPFLEYCRENGIRLAIGSNSYSDRIEWVVKKMKIDEYFLRNTHPEK
jgi:beta-phosphoglucomutase-like phosphatase (HAD superfamily)